MEPIEHTMRMDDCGQKQITLMTKKNGIFKLYCENGEPSYEGLYIGGIIQKWGNV